MFATEVVFSNITIAMLEQEILGTTYLSITEEQLGKNHGTFIYYNFMQALKIKYTKKCTYTYTYAKVFVK